MLPDLSKSEKQYKSSAIREKYKAVHPATSLTHEKKILLNSIPYGDPEGWEKVHTEASANATTH
jgi:hypothetical protein